MSGLLIPSPLTKDEVLAYLAEGACIQRDRHGAAVIMIFGRCAEDWEEMRKDGWLSQTTSGNFVLSEHGHQAVSRREERR